MLNLLRQWSTCEPTPVLHILVVAYETRLNIQVRFDPVGNNPSVLIEWAVPGQDSVAAQDPMSRAARLATSHQLV